MRLIPVADARRRPPLPVTAVAGAFVASGAFAASGVLAPLEPGAATLQMGLGLVGVCSGATYVAVRRATARRARDEARVVSELLAPLPDDYALVSDVALGGRRGGAEQVLVGPCGVILVAARSWPGTISCDGDDWFVDGRPARSVSRESRARAAALREFLQHALPDLGASAAPFVEAVVVFTHPESRIELRRSRTFAVRPADLPAVLETFARRIRMSPALAARVTDALARAPRR